MQETMSSKVFWFFIVSTSFIQHTISDSDWTKQCNICSCIWVSGRRTANCTNKGFNQIPKDLSTVVRDIDFSNNPLYSLSDGEFVSANLVDIHKLKFQNCSIETLNEGAFKRLALVIELDLSRNLIVELKGNTFRDNIKLRILILSYNKIKVLEDGLFSNMSYVQRIHVDQNEIEQINENTFYNLPSLTDISLGYNRLKTVGFDLKDKLPKLNSLNVEENPWICDCRLELFHQSIIRNNLITHVTKCEEPPKLHGRLWTAKETFPCAPIIINPLPSTQITATSNNITLSCKVSGEPEPDVDWINNGHIVERDPRKNKQKYFTSKSKTGEYTWNNLTITNLSYKDKGDYRCIAKNPGGEDEKNVTLILNSELFAGGSISGLGGSSVLIIALSIGLIILLAIILILVCLFCKRANNRALNSKRRELDSSSEECINMSAHLESKKGLITDVNPICKPPRASVPASVVSGGTEVSDAKRNLLDNESMFDCDDESRSFDFDQPLLRKSHNALLEPDYRHNNLPYPPDLLPFPPRKQISPAGSNASTAIIDSRLPAYHGPQSPLQSPIYDHPSVYKTLPYSRSHSPFAPGAGVARIPKQGSGYVTIPRRPRQSWSSEPPPMNEVIGEPLYDNLGVRATVDGSSTLSLNKAGSEAASTPRSNRLFPLSVTTIGPIVESHESPCSSAMQPELPKSSSPQHIQSSTIERQSQSPETTQPDSIIIKPRPVSSTKPPAPQKPFGSQTLPRNLNSTRLTPTRTQWAMENAEQLRSPSDKRNSIASDTPSSEGKIKKIPPRPPPKPKKRVSSGPLFEDEGEDGTEV